MLINRLHGQSKARHTCDNVRNVIRPLFRQATRDELFKFHQSIKPLPIGTSSGISNQLDKHQGFRVNFSLTGRKNTLQMLP
jgi:hypothetical protein